MPTISMFYGIIITLYFSDTGRHNLPHFHAKYGDNKAVFDLKGEIVAGRFPANQASFVKAWSLLHEDELKANWELVSNNEMPFRIEGLK